MEKEEEGRVKDRHITRMEQQAQDLADQLAHMEKDRNSFQVSGPNHSLRRRSFEQILIKTQAIYCCSRHDWTRAVTAIHGIILTRHGMVLTHDHSIQALSVEQASTIEGLELRNTNLDLDKDRLTAELKTAHGQIDGLEVRSYLRGVMPLPYQPTYS